MTNNMTVTDVLSTSHEPELVRTLWHDWHCRERFLPSKGKKLLAKLAQIAPSPRFRSCEAGVFLTNLPTGEGKKTRDALHVFDPATDDVLYVVCPSGKKSAVWGAHPETGEWVVLVRGGWREVVRFFKVPDEETSGIIAASKREAAQREAEAENEALDAEIARIEEADAQTRALLAELVAAQNADHCARLEALWP